MIKSILNSLVCLFFILLPHSIQASPQDFLSPEEREWIRQMDGKIRVAPDPYFPPLEYFDEQGQLQGIAADYLHIIQEKLEISFEILRVENFEQVLTNAKNRDIDMVTTVIKTPERSRFLSFTEPYITIPNVIVVRDSITSTLTIEDLRGMPHVVYQGGYTIGDYLKENHGLYHLRPINDPAQALMDLSTGQIQAMVGNLGVISFYINQLNLPNLRVAGNCNYSDVLSFASRSDWPTLNSILDKVLNEISPEERQTIQGKWIGLKMPSFYDYPEFRKVLIALVSFFLLVIGALYAWNRTLKKQVALRVAVHKKAKEKILLNEKRLQVLLDLNLMKDADKRELTHFAMEAAVMLTGSSIGYIAFPSEDETVLDMYAWSSKAMQQCAVKDKPFKYNVRDTGLWGEAIRQRCAIITNDYAASNPLKKGMPPGHIPIVRHMNVPIFDGDRIVIVAGVGNKQTDYGDDDIRQLTLLMSGLWSILSQKKSEQEQEKLRDQLLQAQKMESVGIMAGGVAHDFNNLLHTMRGNLELLTVIDNIDSRSTERLKIVTRSIDRAAQLVQQLLLFSRKAKSSKVRVYVNREVQDVVQILKRTIPKMINLDLQLNPDIYPLSGDPAQIEQIVLNLANNAVDAMPDGGTLTIETSNVELDADILKSHPDASLNHYVLLAVSDTGCGMDDETLKHIYDPFFTTKEVGKGTGLGLPSVYGIVKAHGGFIDCSSGVGKGTTFKIYLPVLEEEQELTIDQQSETEPQGGNETILIVDDEIEILELTQEILEESGYTVINADSGEKAIEKYRKYQQKIDLVLMDLNMPGMGGHKCLQEILKIDPSAHVIIASGYTASSSGQDVLSAGAKGFIGKPYQLAELLIKIRETLDVD